MDSEDVVDDVNALLKLGVGDSYRLEHIKLFQKPFGLHRAEIIQKLTGSVNTKRLEEYLQYISF